MIDKKHYEFCPGCDSKMEEVRNAESDELAHMECPNPNCDWFAD